MGLNKLNTIADLLDGKGSILVRNTCSEPEKWFVHCHWNWNSWVQSEVTADERIKKVIFKDYVTDLEAALDVIIEKLGGK
jgi:hypothetical protein